jgi:hypothetical protein
MLCRSSGRRFFPETVLSETTSSNLPQSRLPGRQNFWQHLTVTEKRLQPIFMSASVGMQRGLSLSLLQQRLTPKLLPPRISLGLVVVSTPLPFHPSPTFVNHDRGPDGSDPAPPLPLFFAVILNAVKDPLFALRLPVARVLLAFLAVILEGNRLTSSLHANLLKNRITQGPEILTSPAPDIYPASPTLPSSIGADPRSHHAESPEAHASYPPPESPAS